MTIQIPDLLSLLFPPLFFSCVSYHFVRHRGDYFDEFGGLGERVPNAGVFFDFVEVDVSELQGWDVTYGRSGAEGVPVLATKPLGPPEGP